MKKSLILALLLTGCATPGSEAVKPDPKQVDEMRATAKTLATQLGGKLKQEIEANGPASAVGVCKKIAPQIAADLSKQTGWKVGRVGTRARNPESGTPDEWNARALAVFAERMKKGEKPDAMELAEVVTAPSGQSYLRYAKAIAIQPMCVTCHGLPKDIPEDVKARLQAEYPMDKATGYRVGDLRGAVVIMRPL
ncbi:MAG: DUF3365 domain-containing protein [Sulfuricella sp.]|jgi:cytochrome c553|nr:DUF3365 domain-containing protein [Sulfuricella sp.]